MLPESTLELMDEEAVSTWRQVYDSAESPDAKAMIAATLMAAEATRGVTLALENIEASIDELTDLTGQIYAIAAAKNSPG